MSRAGAILVLIIVLLAALFGGAGFVFLERSSRRAARTARRENADQRRLGQFTQLLQVTRSEGEAHALLKRHLERTVPGSAVVVLNRKQLGQPPRSDHPRRTGHAVCRKPRGR